MARVSATRDDSPRKSGGFRVSLPHGIDNVMPNIPGWFRLRFIRTEQPKCRCRQSAPRRCRVAYECWRDFAQLHIKPAQPVPIWFEPSQICNTHLPAAATAPGSGPLIQPIIAWQGPRLATPARCRSV